jgi:hypothetical protein
MSLFDSIRTNGNVHEPAPNNPEMLSCKLLFKNKPVIDSAAVLDLFRQTYPSAEIAGEGDTVLFAIPEIKIELSDATIPAQCSILGIGQANVLPEEALQQNWHWQDAATITAECRYELFVNDFMTRTLDYKTRQELFTAFLIAVVKATQPDVVYSLPAKKLIPFSMLLDSWEKQLALLDILINVRLYNVSNSADGELIMDTIGLNAFGLPDLEIRFVNDNPTEVANLLWNYAYYIFDKGDIIEDGNTVQGIQPDTILTCQHAASLLPPGRQVISIF